MPTCLGLAAADGTDPENRYGRRKFSKVLRRQITSRGEQRTAAQQQHCIALQKRTAELGTMAAAAAVAAAAAAGTVHRILPRDGGWRRLQRTSGCSRDTHPQHHGRGTISSRIGGRVRCKVIHDVSSMKGAAKRIAPPAHPTQQLVDIIRDALAEDAGDRGDITCLSTIPPATTAQAQFLAKGDGVIAGIDLADRIFMEVDPQLESPSTNDGLIEGSWSTDSTVRWAVQDGDDVRKGLQFGFVSGNARSILVAERVVLNFMQRMSGIATFTKIMAEAAKPARILDTRKTAPGLRVLDKWAVAIGTGENHRMGLYDMVMVKDNHIDVAGGITSAIAAVYTYIQKEKLNVGVEVETRTLEEVQEVLDCIRNGKGKVTRIMLDNMVKRSAEGSIDVSMLEAAVDLIHGAVDTEASGNVTLETAKKIGATGVTYISSGALTHSVDALDISMKIRTDPGAK